MEKEKKRDLEILTDIFKDLNEAKEKIKGIISGLSRKLQ